jgi:molybdopterin-guanine dinucleotide biosynthesis protein A
LVTAQTTKKMALMVKNISGVILAGGAGKRFNGKIKPKILIDGKTIISRITETLAGIFNDIIIVTNTPQEFADFKDFRLIRDRIVNKGPLGGIHAALNETENEAVFVVGGDMPLLDASLILKQTEFYFKHDCDILIPRIKNLIEPLHGIYKKSLTAILEDYLTRGNDLAIREFLKIANVRYQQPEDLELALKAFSNINSPEDVLRVESLLRDHN